MYTIRIFIDKLRHNKQVGTNMIQHESDIAFDYIWIK